MSEYATSRLLIHVDDADGCIDRMRSRPGGRRLPIREAARGLASTTTPPDMQVNERVEVMQSLTGAHTAAELLRIETRWPPNDRIELRRTFRTPLVASIQMSEALELAYAVRLLGGPAQWALLLFEGPLQIFHGRGATVEGGFSIRTIDYQIDCMAEIEGAGRWYLMRIAASEDVAVVLDAERDCSIRLLISIASVGVIPPDRATHLLPVPLDHGAFMVASLAPGIMSTGLSPHPQVPVVRPPPPLLYRGGKVTSTRSSGLLTAIFPGSQHRKPNPSQRYYGADLIRVGDALVCYWQESIEELLVPLVAYLKALPLRRSSSLQLILVLAKDELSAQRVGTVHQQIGNVTLKRLESRVPTTCELEFIVATGRSSRLASEYAELGRAIDSLQSREIWVRSMPIESDALPPVSLPSSDDPALLAPFLAAARLRPASAIADRGIVVTGGSWPTGPRPLSVAPQGLDVARFLLTDLTRIVHWPAGEEAAEM